MKTIVNNLTNNLTTFAKTSLTLATAAGFAGMALLGASAQADYPDKPVEFVVPFPPGDQEDILTRMIAEDFQAEYGVPAAVVNKPGGGGGPFPGALEVANGPTDGSVIGSFVIGVLVNGPKLGLPGLDEDTFEPLGAFLTYPFVIAAPGDAPYQSLEELAEYAKTNELALGHFGTPLTPTQVTLALAKEMDFEWGSDAPFDALDCNTLASGDVDVMNTTLQLILPCLDELTILGAVTDERISILPDVPTVAEVVPELELALWNGLFVKKEVSQEVRDKVIAVAKETVLGDRAQQLGKDTGAGIYWRDADDMAAQIEQDRATMERIAELLN